MDGYIRPPKNPIEVSDDFYLGTNKQTGSGLGNEMPESGHEPRKTALTMFEIRENLENFFTEWAKNPEVEYSTDEIFQRAGLWSLFYNPEMLNLVGRLIKQRVLLESRSIKRHLRKKTFYKSPKLIGTTLYNPNSKKLMEEIRAEEDDRRLIAYLKENKGWQPVSVIAQDTWTPGDKVPALMDRLSVKYPEIKKKGIYDPKRGTYTVGYYWEKDEGTAKKS